MKTNQSKILTLHPSHPPPPTPDLKAESDKISKSFSLQNIFN